MDSGLVEDFDQNELACFAICVVSLAWGAPVHVLHDHEWAAVHEVLQRGLPGDQVALHRRGYRVPARKKENRQGDHGKMSITTLQSLLLSKGWQNLVPIDF